MSRRLGQHISPDTMPFGWPSCPPPRAFLSSHRLWASTRPRVFGPSLMGIDQQDHTAEAAGERMGPGGGRTTREK